jgi:hypothetical protein
MERIRAVVLPKDKILYNNIKELITLSLCKSGSGAVSFQSGTFMKNSKLSPFQGENSGK